MRTKPQDNTIPDPTKRDTIPEVETAYIDEARKAWECAVCDAMARTIMEDWMQFNPMEVPDDNHR